MKKTLGLSALLATSIFMAACGNENEEVIQEDKMKIEVDKTVEEEAMNEKEPLTNKEETKEEIEKEKTDDEKEGEAQLPKLVKDQYASTSNDVLKKNTDVAKMIVSDEYDEVVVNQATPIALMGEILRNAKLVEEEEIPYLEDESENKKSLTVKYTNGTKDEFTIWIGEQDTDTYFKNKESKTKYYMVDDNVTNYIRGYLAIEE